ncbi:MAG: VanZ family protein [Bacteriovoracaceae bacterium]|nr:VanZ family protein [Bacteriovoracaceae bacterium]
MKTNLKFIFFWKVICHLTALIVFIACLYPSSGKVPKYEYLDKILHFSSYALLGFLYSQVWNLQKLTSLFTRLFLFGFLIELLQLVSTTRSYEHLDLLANAAGIFYGIIFGISLGSNFFQLIENLRFQSHP